MVISDTHFNIGNITGIDQSTPISPLWFNAYKPNKGKKESTTHYSDPEPDITKLTEGQVERLREHDWIDLDGNIKPITYTTFNDGFRTPISDKSSSVFLGCSHTFGTALRVEQTFAYKVSKELKLTNINLGMPGASLDYCYRMLKTYENQIKPKYIFCLTPGDYRTEFFVDSKFVKQNYNHSHNHNYVKNINFSSIDPVNPESNLLKIPGGKEYVDFLIYYGMNIQSTPEMRISNYNRNLDAIQHLADKLGATFIEIPIKHYWDNVNGKIIDQVYGRARDLLHFGEKFHDIVTSDFISRI